jgi:cephalosporin hydroxylase
MGDDKKFKEQSALEIQKQGTNPELGNLTRDWFNESIKSNYSYHFEWLGRPVIQYPQDIVGTQQLLWDIKPDLVIETGIARGGSLIFYSSILELNALCGGPADAEVLGIDIDIRSHNKDAILAHPMSKRIEMIQGSSIDDAIFEKVKAKALGKKKILVCLDSNHTHDHVLRELQMYAPLVSSGSYIIVFDTVVEDLPAELIVDRPWSKGNNPKTAVYKYLEEIKSAPPCGLDGKPLNFEIDQTVQNRLLITVAPDGFLKRV